MKTIDLNSETATKIISSATELFNLNGYAGTSISDISKKAELSKGILYHYFKDKDALYIHCVTQCVKDFTSYMAEHTEDITMEDDEVVLKILKIRLMFFEIYPQYSSLLNNIISLKPTHISDELLVLKKMLREDTLTRVRKLTKNVKFGKGITDTDIMTFLTILQNKAHFIGELHNGVLPTDSISAGLRITKIFMNGLKVDIE